MLPRVLVVRLAPNFSERLPISSRGTHKSLLASRRIGCEQQERRSRPALAGGAVQTDFSDFLQGNFNKYTEGKLGFPRPLTHLRNVENACGWDFSTDIIDVG